MKTSRPTTPAVVALCFLLGGGISYLVLVNRPVPAATPTTAKADTSQTSPKTTASTIREHSAAASLSVATVEGPAQTHGEENTGPVPHYAHFKLRPFAVAKSSSTHEWTNEDCLGDEALWHLAHSALEEEYYKDQNKWTERRQLVYRKEKVLDFFSELENGTRKSFVVPGFDGAEYMARVISVKRFSAGAVSVVGTIEGYPGSLFSLGGSEEGHEAMTYHVGGKHIEVNSRELNEVVLSLINDEKMANHAPAGSEPVLNDDVGSIGQPSK